MHGACAVQLSGHQNPVSMNYWGHVSCLLGSRWRQQLENSYRAKLISQLRSVNENCFSSMSVFLCSLIKNIGSKTWWQRFEIVEYWRRYRELKPSKIIFGLNWEKLEAPRDKITFGDCNLHDALSNFHIMFWERFLCFFSSGTSNFYLSCHIFVISEKH